MQNACPYDDFYKTFLCFQFNTLMGKSRKDLLSVFYISLEIDDLKK